jgi:hypothetical protein
MHALLTVIIAWLAVNFDLPVTDVHPQIAFVQPSEMAAVRIGRASENGPDSAEAESDAFFAVYDDQASVMYLPADWSPEGAAATSLLVHEMVHHLQNVAGLTYACAGEREKPAYAAQRAWLELFDMSIEEEFSLDAMTILVRTNCGV